MRIKRTFISGSVTGAAKFTTCCQMCRQEQRFVPDAQRLTPGNQLHVASSNDHRSARLQTAEFRACELTTPSNVPVSLTGERIWPAVRPYPAMQVSSHGWLGQKSRGASVRGIHRQFAAEHIGSQSLIMVMVDACR